MKRLIIFAAAALTATFTLTPGTAHAAAKPPTPERMQAWANKAQNYDVLQNDKEKTLRNTPLELFKTLNDQYSSMMLCLQLKTAYEASPEAVVLATELSEAQIREAIGELGDVADQGSEYVDIYRSMLTHSPDRKLNKRMNEALSEVGDVFDSVHKKHYKTATQDNYRANALWAEVQRVLGSYGIDPAGGGEWSLATGKSELSGS